MFKHSIIIFFTICTFGLHTSIHAQQPVMWQITSEDGLPSMWVYDIHQDRRGFIWLATEVGICRYDGTAFKIIPVPQSKNPAVSNIEEDQFGRIWFDNFIEDYFYYDPLDKQMYTFVLPDSIQQHYNGASHYGFEIDQHNNLWLSNKRQIIGRYNISDQSWKSFVVTEIPMFFNYGLDKKKGLWAIQSVFNKEDINPKLSHKLIHIQEDEIVQKKDLSIAGGSIFPTSQGVFMTTAHQGIYLIKDDQESRVLNKYNIIEGKQGYLIRIKEDQNKNIWIFGAKGAWVFNADLQAITFGESPQMLKGQYISNLIQDQEGNYWISTLGHGVYIIPALNVLNYKIRHGVILQEDILCMTEDHLGNLILASNDGQITLFHPPNQLLRQYILPNGNNIETIFFHKPSKRLFVENGAVFEFIYESESPVKHFRVGSTPKDMAIYKNNNLLIASGDGAYAINITPPTAHLDPLKSPYLENFTYFKNYGIKEHILKFRNIRSRAIWGDTLHERIWVAYTDDLYYYEAGNEFIFKGGSQKPLIAKDIIQDQEGILWVATLRQGIFGIKSKKIIYHYDQSNGLISNNCRVLKVYNQELWIGTNQGIQCLDLKTHTFRTVDRQDGLISSEVNDMVIQDDKVWVGTSLGLMSFDRQLKTYNKFPPPIYITSLKIWEKDTLLQTQQTYQLSHHQNNLKIEFRGLAYRSRGKFQYKYRLLNLDTNWVYAESKQNFARYPSLPPGKYTFEVKAVNEDGVESTTIAKLKIQINYPYWQTWWFLILMILSILSLVSVIFSWRLRAIRAKNQIEEELLNSRLIALKSQMNPHFIFNALNSIQDFILQNEKLLANRYLGKFADLMRLTLNMSNYSKVLLEEELKNLKLYLELEALRFEDTFHYEIQLDSKISVDKIELPSMLIQPYVENAIKHGLRHRKDSRRLWVRFRLSPQSDILYCEIEDNGIGRAKSRDINQYQAKKYPSFAMNANRKRLEILNLKYKKNISLQIHDLKSNSHQAIGTKVVLSIVLT